MSAAHPHRDVLKPHVTDLKKTRNIGVLRNGITEYLHSARHPDACERAGRIYLAVALSMCQAKLLRDPADFPDLNVDDGSAFFTVSVGWMTMLLLPRADANALNSRTDLDTVPRSHFKTGPRTCLPSIVALYWRTRSHRS